MATYPDSTALNLGTLRDGVDTVVASNVNTVYRETEAIAVVLGANPNTRTAPWATSPFDNSSQAFTTLKMRLDNVENGANFAYTYLVNKAGGTTITPSAAGVVGATVKATSGQTANLMEFQTSGSSTPVSYFKPDGTFFTPVIDGGSA